MQETILKPKNISRTINWWTARRLLEEGDVLLFRGTGIVSTLIKRAGEGKYTHVGVASAVRDNGDKIWECIEFREWKGGRAVNLKNYCDTPGITIDVYRPVPHKKILTFNDEHKIVEEEIPFDGKAVTNTMRKMSGLPYGWKRIWWIAQHKLAFLRIFYNIDSVVDDSRELIYPVCSTSVAYSFSKIGYDLTHHRSDNAMEPSDVARSPLLFHIFTIES